MLMKLEFSGQVFRKKKDLQISWKSGPVGTELFHGDGRKDRRTYITKLIVAFRNFANALRTHYPAVFYKHGYLSPILCMLRVPPISSPFHFIAQIIFAVRCKILNFSLRSFLQYPLTTAFAAGKYKRRYKIKYPQETDKIITLLNYI